MTADQGQFPGWAERDRDYDLVWIAQNVQVLWPFASAAYVQGGRGAVFVATTLHVTGKGHPYGYFSQSAIEKYDDEDIKRMVREYDPDIELVVVLVKAQAHMSTYRVRTLV
jgi:hypothetical protein